MSTTNDVDVLPAERDKRKLRACLLCGLVKTAAQFKSNGCDNCEELLHLRESNKRVLACTSSSFDGVVAQLKPELSWVSKWQRTDKFTKGMYAIRIAGQLPEDMQSMLFQRGIKYRPRDGSVKD
ncbi:Spt4/RpoE2 zinc finger-domain-containing protein [Fimicolochytrium jonesii]|uniref:Spt4/RpoE2 zinc finger-domain-containing protein n=1 Tax=Fimicolochytrium jonesii TaxID=1396493 RepID=UPI0022FDFFF8|nr:Spt4/RpoE2 zinc finger-domain-containing protein [Fimicolochytrium jonesii]KAI8817542.1 Spt4/RpoE2 zinc finger-domain-containing protein [Fimicolochytrium jonesii]